MRTLPRAAIGLAVGLSAYLGVTTAAQADITGSAHDLSGAGGSFTTQICKHCHIPHNAQALAGAPLWNHLVTSQIFIPYGDPWGSMVTPAGAPTGVSLLCLSCHDGVTNIDSFGETTGAPGAGTDTINGGVNFNFGADVVVGTDLRNDHPISITYNTAMAAADGGMFNPSVVTSGLGSTIAEDMLFGASNDQVQCASCHDVHNGPEVTAAGGYRLLRKTMAGSALCLTCHDI